MDIKYTLHIGYYTYFPLYVCMFYMESCFQERHSILENMYLDILWNEIYMVWIIFMRI